MDVIQAMKRSGTVVWDILVLSYFGHFGSDG